MPACRRKEELELESLRAEASSRAAVEESKRQDAAAFKRRADKSKRKLQSYYEQAHASSSNAQPGSDSIPSQSDATAQREQQQHADDGEHVQSQQQQQQSHTESENAVYQQSGNQKHREQAAVHSAVDHEFEVQQAMYRQYIAEQQQQQRQQGQFDIGGYSVPASQNVGLR